MPKYLSHSLQWPTLEVNLKQRETEKAEDISTWTDWCLFTSQIWAAFQGISTCCLSPGWLHVILLFFMSHEGHKSRSQMACPSESWFQFQDLAPWGWLMDAWGSLSFTFPEVTMELAKPSWDLKKKITHTMDNSNNRYFRKEALRNPIDQ